MVCVNIVRGKNMRLSICLFFALCVSVAGASELDFTWSGARPTHGFTGLGSGSIDFGDGLTNVGLSDLTGFQFTYQIDSFYQGVWTDGTPTIDSISDLESFNFQAASGNPGVAGVEAFGFRTIDGFRAAATTPGDIFPWYGINGFAVYGPWETVPP